MYIYFFLRCMETAFGVMGLVLALSKHRDHIIKRLRGVFCRHRRAVCGAYSFVCEYIHYRYDLDAALGFHHARRNNGAYGGSVAGADIQPAFAIERVFVYFVFARRANPYFFRLADGAVLFGVSRGGLFDGDFFGSALFAQALSPHGGGCASGVEPRRPDRGGVFVHAFFVEHIPCDV